MAITDHVSIKTGSYLTFDTIEGAAADEEYILRIDSDHLLFGVLTATVWRHEDNATLEEFKESLLHALTTHITSDRGVIALASDLIDLIDKDDATFSLFDIIIASLEKTSKQRLDILADITGLGKDGSVDDCKWDVKEASY